MANDQPLGKQRDPEDVSEPLLTAVEVARWLKVAPGTVRRIVPGTKIGRIWRYRRSDVLDFIERGQQGAA